MAKGLPTPRAEVLQAVHELMTQQFTKDLGYVVAGSLRRGKAEVSDCDVLLFGMPSHLRLSGVRRTRGGSSYAQYIYKGIQFDFRRVGARMSAAELKQAKPDDFLHDRDRGVVDPAFLGSFLLHYTGGGKFNQFLRILAIRQGFSLSEYGLQQAGKPQKPSHRDKDPKTGKDRTILAAATESGIFAMLGLSYIPPYRRSVATQGEFNKLLSEFHFVPPPKITRIPLLGRRGRMPGRRQGKKSNKIESRLLGGRSQAGKRSVQAYGLRSEGPMGVAFEAEVIYTITSPSKTDVYSVGAEAFVEKRREEGARLRSQDIASQLRSAEEKAGGQEHLVARIREDILSHARAEGLIVSHSGRYLIICTSLVSPKKIAWHPTVGYVALTNNIPSRGFAKWRQARKFLLPSAKGSPKIPGE